MFDITDLYDDYNRSQEQTYRPCVGYIDEATDNMLTRVEKRLGRALNAEEGQVLVHEYNADRPSNLPRFGACFHCGRWVDRGKLDVRSHAPLVFCDDCVPF